MRRWQRHLRTAVGLGAVVFAVGVVVSLRERRVPVASKPVASADPSAVVESAAGHTLRVNREREDIRVEYARLMSYGDGSTRMLGIKVITERAGGRTFTVTADEGRSGQNESTIELKGHVHLTSNDGIDVQTAEASYADQDGVVRAPGPVAFVQGRTKGEATGFRYDKSADRITLLADVAIHLAQGAAGSRAPSREGDAQDLEIVARSAEYLRPERTIRFDGAARAVRGTHAVEGDSMVALLDGTGDHLERLTLTGGGRVRDTAPSAGGLGTLSGRNVELVYRPGGTALDHVRVVGDGRLTMAGQRGPGSDITADSIAVVMADDGTTPISLDASSRVVVSLPVDAKAPARTVSAQEMSSHGEGGGQALSRARFEGEVVFREKGTGAERTARSGALDVGVSAGLGSLDDARFTQGVRFEDGRMVAEAQAATYLVSKGSLSLRRSAPLDAAPRLKNDRIAVSAEEIDVVLDGPTIDARRAVKSELVGAAPRPGAGSASGPSTSTKVPSMLKADKPVSISADLLTYDGKTSVATYRGGAQLWQGETTIRAAEITLDERTGDLRAAGTVTTSFALRATQATPRPSGTTESAPPTPSTASAEQLRYEEGSRRATYTGQARLTGDQGDLSATTIEMYLRPSGDELDRLEAYENVALRDRGRRTTGQRLTYTPVDERYLVTGAPVTIVDECARETVGRTLIFNRTEDTLLVDGNERARTRTKGRADCQ